MKQCLPQEIKGTKGTGAEEEDEEILQQVARRGVKGRHFDKGGGGQISEKKGNLHRTGRNFSESRHSGNSGRGSLF